MKAVESMWKHGGIILLELLWQHCANLVIWSFTFYRIEDTVLKGRGDC